MNEIKVTVTYEAPKTTKFDALMEEYKAAKQLADETVAYYQPLADVAEDAKFDAIIEQLETIQCYAQRIANITQENQVRVYTYCNGYMFSVLYKPYSNFPFEITWDGASFTKDNMHKHHGWFCEGKYNIVGDWDKWGVYKALENNACSQLTRAIKSQAERAQKQIDRLNNIVKN